MSELRRLVRSVIASIPIFELELLVFPVAVVCITVLSLIAGGRCAAWQWWLAVCLSFLSGLLRGRRSDFLIGSSLFILFLGAFWLWSGVLITPAESDNAAYHLPATRMLIEGWNPVLSATPEQLRDAMRVDLSEFRVWHVLSMPRAVWIFNAEASFFSDEPMNLHTALVPFIVLPCMLQLLKCFLGIKGVGAFLSSVLTLAILLLVPSIFYTVDIVVACAGCGLLVAMYDAIVARRWSYANLLIFSFWMCVVKQPSMLHCALFWLLFTVFFVRCRKNLWREVLVGLPLLVLVCLASISPYWTMFRNYGHPLYPKFTINESMYPVHDLVVDFTYRNSDGARLGYLGSIVNAFVDPDLVRLYYCKCKGESEFTPRCQVWDQYVGKGARAPTTRWRRLYMLTSCLIVLLFGTKTERLFFLMTFAGLIAMPIPLMGYLRYVPWWPILGGWAVLGLYRKGHDYLARGAGYLVFGVGIIADAQSALDLAEIVDYSRSARILLGSDPPINVYEKGENPRYICNTRMLLKQERRLHGAKLHKLPAEAEMEIDQYPLFFDSSFRLPRNFQDEQYSRTRIVRRMSAGLARKQAFLALFFRSWSVTMPQLLWMKMRTIWKE